VTRLRAAIFATYTIVLCVPALGLAQPHETPPVEEHGAAARGEGHADEGHGGGHGEHGLDPKRLAFQLINFGLLVGLLGFFGGKAINKALAGRHEQMKRDLDEAQQARAAAEGRLLQQERRMTNLEKEIAALRASIKDEAIKEEERLVAAAEEKSRRIQDETKFLMDQQVREAELRFRAEVATTAVRLAEELVRRSVRPDDETRLLQGFIADLADGGRPAGAAAAATPSAKGPS
jgi:F0F1-type ATP synthase membrane subunit b/b'